MAPPKRRPATTSNALRPHPVGTYRGTLLGPVAAQDVAPPPALAIDPVTGDVLYLVGGERFVLMNANNADRGIPVAFGRTPNGPAVVIQIERQTAQLIPVNGEPQTFPLPFDAFGFALDERGIYYMDRSDGFDTLDGFQVPVMRLDPITGTATQVGQTFAPEGCGGSVLGLLERVMFDEHRLYMRIAGDALISRYAYCDEGELCGGR